MSALAQLLKNYRNTAQTEREKGTYFEELTLCYLQNEATYSDLYQYVFSYSEWAARQGIDKRDIGIDLVAETYTGEIHAIQCKFYAEDYQVQKKDIDSFFTASGKKPFVHRIIVTTTNNWSEHAEDALRDQHTPVTKIDLQALENSQIDWSRYQPTQPVITKPKKHPREHQINAIQAVISGFADVDRGKLIMACGTGKTFTGLKIAEQQVGAGGRVLFLVPSLSLLSQTLTEWTQESAVPLHSFAVCSDSDVGKKRKKDEEAAHILTHELRYPATTEPHRLAQAANQRHDSSHMTVVFSTYHSLEVISRAQREHGLADFDLIICDEAHRTTGATFSGDDESSFVKVHDAAFIRASKRLYMTATPRIYGDTAKASADKGDVTLCSMDDEQLYGKELFTITFSEAVKRGLLVDYKVIVLAVEEAHVNRRLQALLTDENNQLKVDDAAKIIGCWKALAKQGLAEGLADDQQAMQRAVAFCQVIEPNNGKSKTHKVSSKTIASMFQPVVEKYQETELENNTLSDSSRLMCEAAHVDGSMNASQKEEKLAWLKADTPAQTCRILSNVRCLSEGVDVPALDAVLFLTPRNSQIDVVQSVGRVMRIAPNKKRGYVILPVVIPAGMEPHDALNDNKVYGVVWQVLQALRSHDDRFDAMVNKIDLTGHDPQKMEVVAVTDKVQKKSRTGAGKGVQAKRGSYSIGAPQPTAPPEQHTIAFEVGDIERAIYAKLVEKCGNRHHWENWANDIAKIARTHIDRIQALLDDPSKTREHAVFNAFAHELRDDLNNSITDREIVEMLAQHLITQPVFEALFEGYSFASQNPMSRAMQKVLDVLQEQRLEKETDTLQRFYDSVKLRAQGIESAAGKQKIIIELYDKFFRNAFPKMTERLGIVYTPVEVVDFILHSVAHLLQTEFNQSLGSEGVHIIDPFTGTGTFITRLLQSGLIAPEQLAHKYRHEIHANELVLLAYYIAAINIEAVYHDLTQQPYQPFEGICLTDTFQLHEHKDMVDALLTDNSARRKRQKALDIRVIIGNPPYSAGQSSANDNNQNVAYPHLNERIRSTYAARSKATLKNSLYDSYIRAIRWASDRIGNSGIIGFVSGSGYIEKPAMDGMRKALVEEFTNIHVLNLRGDIRKNMLSKGRAQEGQNIFGSGSMTGIAITLFVKNPNATEYGKIHYHDIGNNLSQKEKLERISQLISVAGITETNGWQTITTDQHGDWLKQRDDRFNDYLPLGDKKGDAAKLFDNFSLGVVTNRDAWCYNASNIAVTKNMSRMIDFYNSEVSRFNAAFVGLDKKSRDAQVDGFINTDPTLISWTRALKQSVAKNQQFEFEKSCVVPSLYRPFTKQWMYFNRHLNEIISQVPHIFPNVTAENLVLCISGVGARSGFSILIANALPNYDGIEKSQCFPLYLYETETPNPNTGDLFSEAPTAPRYTRRDAITNEGLAHFEAAYPGEIISKEDVFYYVYGLLHSPDYRERYADNLSKELPRIPCVKSARDFWVFSKAGRDLAYWHLNYETVEPYPVTVVGNPTLPEHYRVEKMKYGKNGKDKDLSTLIYNAHITLTGIPVEAYNYVVNGKPALDWVVERQCVKTDKDSGIINDANDWALETMNNPKYPLELFQRVIRVSLETLKIVEGLPTLEMA